MRIRECSKMRNVGVQLYKTRPELTRVRRGEGGSQIGAKDSKRSA